MVCRNYITKYPTAKLSAVGVLGKNIQFDSFFLSNESKAKEINPNAREYKDIGWFVKEDNGVEDSIVDELNICAKNQNELYGTNMELMLHSEMNNLFNSYADELRMEGIGDVEKLYSYSMPCLYSYLDNLKDWFNDFLESEECVELKKITNSLVIESTSNNAAYKDPIMNILLIKPTWDKVNKDWNLSFLINLAMLKEDSEITRFVTYEVTLSDKTEYESSLDLKME